MTSTLQETEQTPAPIVSEQHNCVMNSNLVPVSYLSWPALGQHHLKWYYLRDSVKAVKLNRPFQNPQDKCLVGEDSSTKGLTKPELHIKGKRAKKGQKQCVEFCSGVLLQAVQPLQLQENYLEREPKVVTCQQ